MVAMTVIALIGLAVTGMIAAISTSQAKAMAINDTVQSGRISMVTLERLIRQARLVSGGDGNHLSLWMGDLNGDGQINANETYYLTYLPSQRVVRMKSIQFPANMDPCYKALLNVSLMLDDSADPSVLDGLLGCQPYIQQQDVAVDVDYVQFQFSTAPPMTKAVTISGRFGTAPQNVSLNSTVYLRGCDTTCITYDGADYNLNIPNCEVTNGS